MTLWLEIKRRAWPVVGQGLAAATVAYFGFHMMTGDRGLQAYLRVTGELEQAKTLHAELKAERQKLEQRVSLLRDDSLDPDMLEERARALINLGREDEVVIFYDHPESADLRAGKLN
ncbi:Cell division protein FtsB [Tistlia consotensis]|uniref:Cell division protein FtsB n=1 Tax=Tistlia consotensis USBA 355 TaxID=560819 RepID=A0A1Y6CVB7_9PROT|nr:septum formation initiator family protein [Tistlia consotensis]SMF80761.1 Cell division protein FtsB [Tistlia consotensis USBA 355]SNS21540.1 Cell division protein FtsB [Tistlia consotensis]